MESVACYCTLWACERVAVCQKEHLSKPLQDVFIQLIFEFKASFWSGESKPGLAEGIFFALVYKSFTNFCHSLEREPRSLSPSESSKRRRSLEKTALKVFLSSSSTFEAVSSFPPLGAFTNFAGEKQIFVHTKSRLVSSF